MRVAQAVRELRGKRSAQWLADRTAELGCPVSRSVISDLENGRRRYVTTAEVTILARALNTAPIALMYPAPYDDTIEMVPGVNETKTVAVQCFAGSLSGRDPRVSDDPDAYERNLEGLRTVREIRIATLRDEVTDIFNQMRRTLDRIRPMDNDDGG